MFDSFPTVSTCCFCVPLRIGCYIIAVYGILGVSLNTWDAGKDLPSRSMIQIYSYIRYFTIALSVTFFIVSIVLLVALIKDNEDLYFPWLWTVFIIIIVDLITCIGTTIYFIVAYSAVGSFIGGVMGRGIVISILNAYFLLVVNSMRMGGD